MTTRPKAVIESRDGEELSPITITKNVLTDDGQNLHDILSDRKEDMMTPTIENSSSMFKVGQGDNVDYSENVVDGAYESCVLKGRSLVNIHKRQGYRIRLSEETQQANKFENIVEGDNHISCNMVDGNMYGWGSYIDLGYINVDMLKPNTKYLVWFELATVPVRYSVSFRDKSSSNPLGQALDIPKGQNYAILTTADEIIKSSQILYISFHQGDVGYYEFKNAMIIEYQEGMENLEIPYFEGICNVKSPILSNVGKNLAKLTRSYTSVGLTFKVIDDTLYVDGTAEKILDYYLTVNNCENSKMLNSLEVGTTVTLSNSLGLKNYFGVWKNGTTNDSWFTNTMTIQKGDNNIRCFIRFDQGSTYNNQAIKIQLEATQNPTTYEPYKSNTTTFEQKDDKTIVLRSLPNGVCDTLNVETGEYIQRIGEIVLDGSDDETFVAKGGWVNDTHMSFDFKVSDAVKEKTNVITAISDKFKSVIRNSQSASSTDEFITNTSSGFIFVMIRKNRLNTQDLVGFKQWLSQNTLTVQYELATPVVKMVDLSGYPFAYKDGHVALSSGSIEQSLTPKVEYSVVTNRNGQIRSNQKMIERQQKQLDRLQTMILANLVNTQYEKTLTNLKYDLKNVREEVK